MNSWVKIFFLAYLILGLWIVPDFGINMDEPIQRKHGMVAFEYVNETFGLFPSAPKVTGEDLSTYDHRDYGMFFQFVAYNLELILGVDNSRDVFLLRHMMVFSHFWLGLVFFYYALKSRFERWELAYAGILFLFLSPRIFGDSFHNPKDIPLLSWFMISIFTLLNFINKPTPKNIFIHALVSALTIGSRIVGVLIPFISILWLFGECLLPNSSKSWSKSILHSSYYLLSVMVFTFLLWPVLWENPIDSFFHSFNSMKKFRWNGSMLYIGEMIDSKAIPWHYAPVWIGVTTPLAILGLFGIGLVSLVKGFLSRGIDFLRERNNLTDVLISLLFFAPLFAVILFNSVLYNGWRHLYFIYPAIVWISVRGIKYLWACLLVKLKPKFLTYTLFLLGSISTVEIVHFLIRYHPHQSVYFNLLAGDVENNFERDYYGVSYKKALSELLSNEKGDTLRIYSRDFIGKINTMNFKKSESNRLQFVEKIEDSDYFITIYNFRAKVELKNFKKKIYPYNNPIIYTIKVKNYPVISIYKLKQ